MLGSQMMLVATDDADLSELLGCGHDLARSILRHHDWQEIARLQKLLESCPQMAELVRTLGRLQEPADESAPSVIEKIFVLIRRALDEWRVKCRPTSRRTRFTA